MKHCNAKTGRWPDASADVSPDEMGDFIAHAETCTYHADILHMEEDDFLSVLRLARGLDSAGRVLRGDELQQAIAEHENRVGEWKRASGAESSFGLISLYNGGKLIASCGDFLDFTDHQSLHELNPKMGLQIRARCSSDNDEEVLLGFYALLGVCHDGEEQLLPLDKGYTVGLKVKKSGDRTFRIKFRCVENSIIEQEKVATGTQPGEKAKSANGSSFNYLPAYNYVPVGLNNAQIPSGWFLPSKNLLMNTMSVLLSVLVLVYSPGYISLGKWINPEKTTTQVSTNNSYGRKEVGEQPPLGKTFEDIPQGAPEPQLSPSAAPKNSPSASNASHSKKRQPDTKPLLAANKRDALPVVRIRPWVIPSSFKDQIDTGVEMEHRGVDPELENEVWNAVSDEEFADKMWKTLAEESRLNEVAENMEPFAPKTTYEALWKIIRPQSDGIGQVSIQVEVRTSSNAGNGLPPYREKFPVSANDAGLDYEDAVKRAVKKLYAHVKELASRAQSESMTEAALGSTPDQKPPNDSNGDLVNSHECDPK